uniref:Uncharacterized protein n=1 Tax=Arundo donax TaxID=35708 RepID=A0A0A9DK23_ARUDO
MIIISITCLKTQLRCDQSTSDTHNCEGRQFELIYILQEKPNHTTRVRSG